MDRVSSCNIYVIQRDTQYFMFKFIHNIQQFNMFRTSMVHPQERFQAVCCKFGMLCVAYYSIRSDVLVRDRTKTNSSYNRITSGRIE